MKNDRNHFIIDKSELLKPRQKVTALGITLIFWGVFLYLLQPVLSLLAWSLNIHIFYNHMIVLGGYQAFIETMYFYLAVIITLGGGLIFWGLINFWRFKNKNARSTSEVTSVRDIAHDFGLEEKQLEHYQQSQRVLVKFDRDGKVSELSDCL